MDHFSLALRTSPARVHFLLVDYKGGAALSECTKFPHTVGLVTDLNPQLVSRVIVSLTAEIKRREELLNRYGAKDLVTLEEPPPPRCGIRIVVDSC
ncbi:MAG: hypothetical protein LBP35_00880 [Candidatus Ancillula trichonymphae]|nr:hypothetical protein [Candidatus Ancillula trichonymphae]